MLQDVLQTNKLQYVLSELKLIVNTPIKPFNPPPGIPTTIADGNNASGVAAGAAMEQPGAVNVPPHPDDLPAWITRVMGKGMDCLDPFFCKSSYIHSNCRKEYIYRPKSNANLYSSNFSGSS